MGARGRMGGWFAKLFRSHGCLVYELDRDSSAEDQLKAFQSSNSVLVSVPISEVEKVIRLMIPKLKTDTLLFDLTSLKVKPLAAMLEHKGEVVGLHPMCAPSEVGLVNQPVVVCRGRSGQKTQGLLAILSQLGARIREMDADQHDKLMAIVQGLHHFYAIAFAHSLRTLGITPEETMQVSSPVYELRTHLMGRILAQDPNLYVDIELENPYVTEVLNAYERSVTQCNEIIQRGSRTEALAFFQQAVEGFGDYRFEALKQSDALLVLRQRIGAKE